MQSRTTVKWVALSGVLLVLFVLNLSIGSVNIPFQEIFKILTGRASADPVWDEIILDFRMTKAITCILAGSALSLGGLQMQTLFRNPLAGPDVLGLSAGASLAVSLVLLSDAAGITFLTMQSPWVLAAAASIGCSITFIVMLIVAGKVQDNVSLLIVGLMVGAATSSVVSVLQYLSQAEEIQLYVIWTMGSLGGLNWSEIRILVFVLIMGVMVAIINMKSLNAWLLGDNYARSLGVDLSRSRLYSILSASLLTGGVTAFCGPIAFVGLAVPHLVKLLIKTNNHKTLIPAVLLGGAALLLGCDVLAQLPGGTNILPLNAITAIIGAPVVIWVILRNKVSRP